MNLNLSEQEIIEMNTKELWESLQIIKEELHEKEKIELAKIHNGYELTIHIRYIKEGWYETYPQNKTVIVYGHKHYPINKFYDEKEKRDTEMKKMLIENCTGQEVEQPRT